jgi:hypothetical protein
MKPTFWLLGNLMLAAALTSCGDDNPADAGGRGVVEGKVTFVNTGSWPATGDVQVSIYSSLPADLVPNGPPDGYTNPIAPGTEYTFRIQGLAEGRYQAIYVSWRDPAVPGSATLLGMYWAFVDSVGVASDGVEVVPKDPGPTALNLTGSNVSQSNLDITADLDLAP